MFIPFDGHCPICGGVGMDVETQFRGDFVTLLMLCIECDHKFIALYDNDRILKDQ